MKDSNFNKIVLGAALILAAILMMSSCASRSKYHPSSCTVCESVEDPYLCSKHYADKEEPQLLIGSHDFFLEGEDKITSSTLATKCLTCGIHFTHPSYGEHIKTCCP